MLTPKQRLERQKGLGGSDIGAIFGLCPWKTPLDVYLSKVEPIVEEEPTEAMKRGNDREGAILDYYSQAYCGDMGDYFLERNVNIDHAELPFLKGSLDAIEIYYGNDLSKKKIRVIEAKSISITKRKEWGEPGTDQVPYHYLLQVAHYCLVAALKEAHIVVEWEYGERKNPKFESNHYSIYVYRHNPQLEHAIINKAANFWHEHVLKRLAPPPLTRSDAVKLWPNPNQGSVRRATTEELEIITQLKVSREQYKELGKQIALHELNLRASMKDNETLLADEGRVAKISTSDRPFSNIKLIKEHHPEVYQACCKKTPVNRLDVY